MTYLYVFEEDLKIPPAYNHEEEDCSEVRPRMGLASILGLILGGFLFNSIGAVTFLISAGAIFTIFLMSFQLLKWK